MTLPMLAAVVGGGALIVALVVLIVTLRLGGARAKRGAQIQVIGEQPEASEWLTPILDSVADDRWSYETYDLGISDGPMQLRVEMRTTTRDASITIGLDSSHSSGTFAESDPINVMVRLTSSSPASGVLGLLFGQWFQPATRTWRRLVRLIKAQTRPNPGATPTWTSPKGRPRKSRSRKPAVALAVVMIAVIAVIGGITTGSLSDLWGAAREWAGARASSAEPSATSKAVVIKGKKPQKAKACKHVHDTKATPARSAVNSTAKCRFAEEVRLAYIKSGKAGRKVTLKRVYSAASKDYYKVKCTGTKTVTCKGGPNNSVVYLY